MVGGQPYEDPPTHMTNCHIMKFLKNPLLIEFRKTQMTKIKLKTNIQFEMLTYIFPK